MKGQRSDRTGRSKGQGKHVRLYEWMLRSDAYRSLSSHGRSLLVEFGRLFDGQNNGGLFLSVDQAAKRMSVAPNTALKALRELEDRGFIRPHQKGAFTWKLKTATTWVLAEHPFNGKPATKEFMRWKPPVENETRCQNLTPNGVKSCDRGRSKRGKKGAYGVKTCDHEREFSETTVSDLDTQIVYHGGCGEQTPPTTRIWPSRGANDRGDGLPHGGPITWAAVRLTPDPDGVAA